MNRHRRAVLWILITFAVNASSEAPLHSHQSRLSRARIETHLGDTADLLSSHHRCEGGWTEEDLDLRSSDLLTKYPSVLTHQKDAGRLRLHIDEESAPSNDTPIERHNKRYYKKTGTTIAGCICSGHVILAADTRATQESWVADKVAQKLHPLARNAWCAGAGTSADLEALTRLCLFHSALDQLQCSSIGNGSSTSVESMFTTVEHEEDNNALLVGTVSLAQICTFLQQRLLKAQGQLGVNLILGCVDGGTPHLRAFHEHGSMDVDLPFAALGSGGLAAISILERGFHRNMTVPDAIELVQSAIIAGIQNDLGSGSQVDLCVIAPDGTSRLQRCVVPSQKLEDIVTEDKESTPVEHRTGINGFGNTPFGITSQRVIVVSQEGQNKEWSNVLGMTINAETR